METIRLLTVGERQWKDRERTISVHTTVRDRDIARRQLMRRLAVLIAVSAAVVGWAGTSATSGSAAAAKRGDLPAAAASADLAIAISTLPTAQTSGYQYFHVTVTNKGPSPASHVVITGGTPPRSTFYCVTGLGAACGPIVPGVTCKGPTGTTPLTCTARSLKAGTSVSVWMGFHHGFFFPAQAYCDSASVTSTTPDPNKANNTAAVCARVV
jgi:hypothetical protein